MQFYKFGNYSLHFIFLFLIYCIGRPIERHSLYFKSNESFENQRHVDPYPQLLIPAITSAASRCRGLNSSKMKSRFFHVCNTGIQNTDKFSLICVLSFLDILFNRKIYLVISIYKYGKTRFIFG